MDQYIQPLRAKVQQLFKAESSGHDKDHLERVLNLANRLQKTEGGDPLIIAISAFLHDFHRLKEKETKQFCPPKDSLPEIQILLREVKFPEEKVSGVLHCIEYHEEYNFSKTGKTVTDIETQIVQDADNLDAIGAIGIGRTFNFGGAHGLPMWIQDMPLSREFFDESEPDPDTIHHFYSKLFRLKNNMNTKTAKDMAQNRHEFMELFLDHFLKEWRGEL
jgi:uncharacterized protein